MIRKALLACGIAAPALYAVADLVAGVRWEGYSFRDQTISELGAIGAPTRQVFSAFLVAVYALMVGFGVGVWKSAEGRRRLKMAAGLIVSGGVMALAVGQLVAMNMRGTEQGSAGAAHLIEGLAAMVMVFTTMGIASTAFGRGFHFYTIATIALALGSGIWSAMEVSRIGQGLATPWVGVKERIFWYSYQSWYAVFAFMLLRRHVAASADVRRHPQRPSRSRLLICGVVSSVLYLTAIDVIVPLRHGEYHNFTSQMVSELMAAGAPTRRLLVWLLTPYNLLVLVFAAGVWASARGSRAIRLTALALFGYGIVSTAGLFLFPMDLRGTVNSQRDGPHIAATFAMSACIIAVLAFGAFALGRRFRLYSFVTLAVVVGFGILAGVLARPMPGPTPWLGLAERVNIYATMLWVGWFGRRLNALAFWPS